VRSLIQLLATFSTEFILLEAIVLCGLVASYSLAFVIKRRKLGIIETHIPAGPVREILTNFIILAQSLRAELFGQDSRFQQSIVVTKTMNQEIPTQGISGDVQKILADREAKITELQAKIEQIQSDNERNLLAKGSSDPKEVEVLRDKVSNLEARLEEYAIIEDDLANLKAIMQENNQLREHIKKLLNQLGSGSGEAEVKPNSEGPPAA
jgi:hypothetical protein